MLFVLGSVLMNYSTLLDSIKKSAQTQAELINSEMKGVRCVPPLDQQNHSWKSLSTTVWQRIMKNGTSIYNLCKHLSAMWGNFAWSFLDTLETLWPRCVALLDQRKHSWKSLQYMQISGKNLRIPVKINYVDLAHKISLPNFKKSVLSFNSGGLPAKTTLKWKKKD